MDTDNELKKTFHKVDLSITMHSNLRDEYGRRSFLLDLLFLVLSALIAFLAISKQIILEQLLPKSLQSDTSLSILALIILIASIIQWRVGWKEKSSKHEEAVKTLSRYKHELSKTLGATKSVSDNVLKNQLSLYQYANDSIIKIPENQFLKLKKKHKAKVEISRLLDKYPCANVNILKFKLFLRDNFDINLLKEHKEK